MIELDDDNPVNDEPSFEGPPEDDAASNEGTEMEYLKELERIDRLILAEVDNRKADNAAHNEVIKDHEATRDKILRDIAAWRSGERGLFDDPDPA
ncbi:MAG: hypothetical protein ACYSWO_29215 [Planctomycetota bacterium]|jgi:hypothetical protein